MTLKPFIVSLVTLGALGSSGYVVFGRPRISKAPVNVTVMRDVSDSMTGESAAASVRGLSNQALHVPGLKRGSKLFVVITGSSESAMEPVAVGSFDIPVSTRVMEGTSANDTRRRELLAEVVERFKAKAKETKNSPIFLALSRGLSQLRAAGCDEKGSCFLFLGTDGEDTEEPWIKESIRRGRLLPKGAPTPLDNRGIVVTICGFSETRGEVMLRGRRRVLTPKRSAASAGLLTSIWRKVFTEPETVVFEPFCPTLVQQ